MKKKLRAIDQTAFSVSKRDDFKSRDHGHKVKKFYELVLAVLGVVMGTVILVELETIEGGLICLGAGLVLLVFAMQTEKNKILMERSEFLNALFSSVVSKGNKFVVIVAKQTQEIVYLNHGFQDLFPEFVKSEKRTISKLFTTYAISAASKKTITETIKKGASKTVAIEVSAGAKKKKQSLKLTIDSIDRPSGFCIIRGA